jgi:hypothetical protein
VLSIGAVTGRQRRDGLKGNRLYAPRMSLCTTMGRLTDLLPKYRLSTPKMVPFGNTPGISRVLRLAGFHDRG